MDELKLFFEGEEIKSTLIKNYRETLEQYLIYSKEKNEMNLNLFKVKK